MKELVDLLPKVKERVKVDNNRRMVRDREVEDKVEEVELTPVETKEIEEEELEEEEALGKEAVKLNNKSSNHPPI